MPVFEYNRVFLNIGPHDQGFAEILNIICGFCMNQTVHQNITWIMKLKSGKMKPDNAITKTIG